MRSLLPILAAALTLTGCAVRALPQTPAPGSAAAASTGPAPSAHVTTALEQDPPLPGEDEGAWGGLAPAASHSEGGHHHAP